MAELDRTVTASTAKMGKWQKCENGKNEKMAKMRKWQKCENGKNEKKPTSTQQRTKPVKIAPAPPTHQAKYLRQNK